MAKFDPGKAKAAGSAGDHAYDDKTSIKKHDLTVFAKQIAERLESAQNDNTISNFLLVASPKMLGELRNLLSETIKEKVVFELDKNLTEHEPADIRSHLHKYLTHD